MSVSPGWLLLACALPCAGAASGAHAQDACVPGSGEPADLLLTPTVGSPEAVTLDSPVLVRFGAGVNVSAADPAQLLALRRRDEDGSEIAVDGRYERYSAQPNVLLFRPRGGLDPDQAYVGDVRDPAGLDMRELAFETGAREDELEPRLGGNGPRLHARKASSECGAVRVDVAFAPAQDDGPLGSVEHLVFQTRGAGLDAPVLRKRVRATMDSEVSASFLLTDVQASEPVCVQILAVDGTGRLSELQGERCFTPSPSSHFVGACAIGAGPRQDGVGALAGVGGVCLAWLVSRRRLRR